MTTLGRQLRDNAVALISLVVALGSLGYNTWRNERTEHNRNVRTAAFELLMRLGELERVAFLAHYERDPAGGNLRVGWTYIAAIHDLSELVPAPVPAQAEQLKAVWGESSDALGSDDEAAINRIDDAIDKLRRSTLGMLQALR
jgi:hypothetical protein